LVLAGTVLVAAAGAAVGWGSVLVEQARVVADEFGAAADIAQQEAFHQGRERFSTLQLRRSNLHIVASKRRANIFLRGSPLPSRSDSIGCRT
jgi:hypothetical protein